jgi:serine/threonine protein phosphatase 1
VIIIGDVHGCIHTLKDLLALIDPSEEVIFTGDLVDRGVDSKAVVDLVREKGYLSVMGNHERMLLNAVRHDLDQYLWAKYNGGQDTLDNFDGEIPEEYLDYFASMPLYIERGEFLISHSNRGEWETLSESADSVNLLWNRTKPYVPEGVFHVFGHTPLNMPALHTRWANVDTGCVFGNELAAIRLETKEFIQVPMNPKDKTKWSE